MENFSDYGITIPYRRHNGQVKTTCPKCKGHRGNPNDKSLSVNLDMGVWKCHHCGWTGALKEYDWKKTVKPVGGFTRPKPIRIVGLSENAVKWFAGRGISQETLGKMKIAEGMEFMPQDGKEMNTIQFCYYLDDELINVKYRTGNKHFKMVAGAELIPYNIDAIKDSPECIITEGEMDALSFVEVGKNNVVSVPNGANSNLSWLDDFMEGWFEDKETIFIAADTDAKGVALREELIRRFGAERCRVITYGEGCKDANELLIAKGKEALLNAVENSVEVDVDGVYTLRNYETELDGLYENGLQRGMTLGLSQFDTLISFETKRLLIMTGIPGSGKSEFLDEICVLLNIRYGLKVAYFSPENLPLTYHASKILEKIVGKKFRHDYYGMSPDEYEQGKRYMEKNFFHILPPEKYTLNEIIDRAKFLVRRKGIKILVIDPYNRVENDFGTLSETQSISKVLDELINFAIRQDVLVCVVAHPRKFGKDANSDGLPTMYDINGSANFYNKCDYGIIVHRNRADNTVIVRIAKVKFRHLGEPGDAIFRYNYNNGRYVELTDGHSDVNQWDNTNRLFPEQSTFNGDSEDVFLDNNQVGEVPF